jgi:hypothetical protein
VFDKLFLLLCFTFHLHGEKTEDQTESEEKMRKGRRRTG